MKRKPRTRLKEQLQLYAMMLPAILIVLTFCYIPMYGITIAFKEVRVGQGLLDGAWIGFKNFERFFNSPMFLKIIGNTFRITLVKNFLLMPLPIIFALMVHNSNSKRIRKISQTISYLPHLISMVVIIYIINLFCDEQSGLINYFLVNVLGRDSISIMENPDYYYPIYYLSDIWATLGSSAVIYIAALAGVDEQLIEAAVVDGASKIQRIWHIELPAIRSTIVILLVMNMGNILKVGYEKSYLLQNDLNLEVSETIATYVYKTGLVSAQYGFSAAVNLFQNLVGLIMVILCNNIAKKLSDTSLF